MNNILYAYLPQDRYRALLKDESLPEISQGVALFADISGFTSLTEKLTQNLGARRGIEEFTQQINAVYQPLILEIERFGGSVIGFAGDSITCWFDEQDGHAAARAVTCAQSMHKVLQSLENLTVKIAITSGMARRLVVGNPEIQLMDTLAGALVVRLSIAEHLAKQGDVLLDENSVHVLGQGITISEWRYAETGERFAVLADLPSPFTPFANEEPNSLLDDATLKPWVPPIVYEREQRGLGAFLTELRPAVALFLRFSGIDYDLDETAGEKLDVFIRRIQAILQRFEGNLLHLTIGDKGSYIYASFGVPIIHEDDAQRAAKAAWALSRLPQELSFLEPLQIGISKGTMLSGTYGGPTRLTYSAMGDDTNLAARLMTTAAPGEILVSSRVHKLIIEDFNCEPRPPLPIKGKAEPLPVFAVTGEYRERAIRLQEPRYTLPLVGRAQELRTIVQKLDLVLAGQAQVIGIVAEAGIGKSRLVAEVIRSAIGRGFVGYGGACQSDGVNTPYLVWKSIWSAFFDIDPDAPLRRQIRWLEGELEDRAPDRLQALPLLGKLLDITIPENEFTETLEPKVRQSVLHIVLEDCLKSAAQEEPLLIVIEDLHWIDALSHDLLDELVKALANFPVCFLLAYRPPELLRLQKPRLEALPQFTKIALHELTRSESVQAIRAKLSQLYPARSGAVPAGLVDKLMRRAQGNPFYLEELLNYLRDRGLDPLEPHVLGKIELPDSLHSLILSRIDQLTESEKNTLRVASIIGRLFRVRWLTGYYPELGDMTRVRVALDELDRLDITPLDSPEPEMAYLFKHIVTHEVTYESLPFATRARLHERLADFLEEAYPEAPPVEVLAFHYGRSENVEKQREYLRKAGGVAQKNFANDAALAYYGQLLPLLHDAAEKIEIHLMCGKVLELMGQIDEAERECSIALDMAGQDPAAKAGAQFALGKLSRLRGDYDTALERLKQAREMRIVIGDRLGLVQVSIETGMVLLRKGEYAEARQPLYEGLALAREVGDKAGTALALNNLGNMAIRQGDYAAARTLLEESLALRRELGDKQGISASLNNLGIVADDQGDYPAARALYEESLALCKEMGEKWGISVSLNNLAGVAWYQGDFPAARALYEESLILCKEMSDKQGIAILLNNLGNVSLQQGDYHAARALQEECLALCQEMDDRSTMAYALLGLGLVELAEHAPEAGGHILQSLRLRQELGERLYLISSLVGAAGLVLQEGDPQHSAQLLSAVSSALKALKGVMEAEVLHLHAQTLAAVRAALDEEEFQSAWEVGGDLSLDEAVALVLEME